MTIVEFDLDSLMAGMLAYFIVYLFARIGSFLLLRRYVPYILINVLAILYSIYARVMFIDAGYLVQWDTLARKAVVPIARGTNLFIMFKIEER